ncbi:MAG TPA: helix-turn-helix domain-containing protein [Rhizomicrobium sp.]|nr:helix-turn-helix domain-containing protein [Rhizomicrobium sp.]
MALFFDSEWFDQRLAALGLTREAVGAALGFSPEEIAEIWKDQRELRAEHVRLLAALLAVPAKEIAHRAGVSTPLPREDIETRLARVEAELAAIKALLAEKFK